MTKKLQLAVLIGSMVFGLAGCVTEPPAPTPAPIQFNYRVDNAKANGIVQVFDLNGNTVVQIRDVNPKTTHFYDVKNSEIAVKVIGENVVLTGLHPSFTVSTSTAASRVIRLTALPEIPSTLAIVAPIQVEAATPATAAAETDAKLVADIARIRKEISELKAMLAESTKPQPASSLPQTREIPTSERAASPEVIRIVFKDNSQTFEPSDEESARVVALAFRAKSVSICGYTDSPRSTATAVALARGRATAAQKFLIAKGIDRAKITVDFEAAGKFVADNRTKAGRDANRRVEINLS